MSLESKGVTVVSDGVSHTFKGTISFIAADNLGSHGMGGFMESFTSSRICRSCMCTYKSLKEPQLSLNFRERTIDGHRHQLGMIKQHPNLSSVYGVKSNCPFNKLCYFHVIKGLPFDPTHDLLESVCPLVWSKVLTSLVERKHLTVTQMNSKLQSFPFTGSDKSSKPTHVSWSSGRVVIKQNASQMWCFCRLAPVMFGGSVPKEDKIWDPVLQLNDVLNLSFAPRQNYQMVAYLNGLIEDFLHYFLMIFPDDGLTPKMHYLLHYSRQIEQFGPATNCSTIRFEAKHSYFKDLARKTKNRKNLAKTLAQRHQNLMSYYSCSEMWSGIDHITSTGFQVEDVNMFCPKIRDVLY
ncbi:hypothetical protein HOLleu_01506 [Holothuria leucospilota]|uniref:Uncharacterized protein n=1 Tax=Holothuria leucospilota TaxID=206669 RepID=A0A9Q1CNI0_HOLLE|nr:hypothetical protein HOLleu_01506 [Holothuria leucospilota]